MRTSPLDGVHRALGARMVPFGGWEMPLSYHSGTLEEHRACRESAVVFDVSHLGTVRVVGPGAFDTLQATFTNDLNRIAPGRAQYTHLLAEDGSVLDDIIVWWISEDVFDVMPNASNTDRVIGALRGAGSGGIDVTDVTAGRAILAVQGPEARSVLRQLVEDPQDLVGRFAVDDAVVAGVAVIMAGTGYTGEDGVELAVAAEDAETLWTALTSAGAQPAGLGARDTLRLEAGLPLHGHELGPGITPLNAGLGWVVAWDKGDFPGRAALEAQRAAGVSPVLRGLATEGRRPPREGWDVLRGGKVVGRTTSGNFSPTLGHGIALALVEPDVEEGQGVALDARGNLVEAEVVALPFVSR